MKFDLRYLRWFLSGCGIFLLGAGLLWWADAFIPFSDEEIGRYDLFDCLIHPLHRFTQVGEDLQEMELAVPGLPYLPWRSFSAYGGNAPLPTWLILLFCRHPLCLRAMGILLLIFQAGLLSRLFRMNWMVAFTLLVAFMPYAAPQVVDTGGYTHYHVSVVILVYYLACSWVRAIKNNRSGRACIYPPLIGFLFFWAVWLKLSNLFLVPTLAVLLLFNFFRLWNDISGAARRLSVVTQLLILALIAAILTTFLLLAVDRWGEPYYKVITSSPRTPWSDWGQGRVMFQRLGRFFWNPRAVFHYLIEPPAGIPWPGVLLLPLLALQLIIGLGLMIKERGQWSFPALCLVLFLAVELLVFKSDKSWAMHHIILGYPFLVLAWFHILSYLRSYRWVRLLCALFVLVGFTCYIDLAHPHKPTYRASYGYPDICAFVNQNFARSHLCIMPADFHTLKQFWGPRENCVSYIEYFMTEEEINNIRRWQKAVRRPLAFVARDGFSFHTNWWLLRQTYPNLVATERIGPEGWRVFYQPVGEKGGWENAEQRSVPPLAPLRPGPDWHLIKIDPALMTKKGGIWDCPSNETIRTRNGDYEFSVIFGPAERWIGAKDSYALVFELKKISYRTVVYVFIPWHGRQCYWAIGEPVLRSSEFYGTLNSFENNWPTRGKSFLESGRRYRLMVVVEGNRLFCWIDDQPLFNLNCEPDEVPGVDEIGPGQVFGFGDLAGIEGPIRLTGLSREPIVGFGAYRYGARFISPRLLVPPPPAPNSDDSGESHNKAAGL